MGTLKERQWKNHPDSSTARLYTSPKTIKRLMIDEDEFESKIEMKREHIAFADDDYLLGTFSEIIESEGISASEWVISTKEQEVVVSSSIPNKKSEDKDILPETDFLKELETRAVSNNLIYERNDLINFHTSVKSSALTILSGQSGVGKTRLATLYGNALGLSQEKQTMLIMPISPAYTEPGDILGYLNTSTGLYIPAETGLVDFLKHAQEYNKQVHLLIMDEMNLSQIEHWFAPFISLLELEPNERILRLYSNKSVCHNKNDYPDHIKIYDNIIFVGTVNTDETTKVLSDRLLDRSNVVVLEKKSFVEIKDKLQNKPATANNESFSLAYGEIYLKWRSEREAWHAFDDKELEFFDRLDTTISKYDPQKGFSIRNVIRMGHYLNNIPKTSEGQDEIEKKRAIDLFIKQRLLTKIRGPIDIFEELIGTSREEDEVINSKLYDLFTSEAAKNISDFHYTLVELRKKAKELLLNGYAS